MTKRLVTVLSLFLMLASAVLVASPANAALGLRDTADAAPWMTNGKVYAQALSEDGRTLYIGGRFTQLRERPPGAGGATLAVNNVAAIDVATGAPVGAFKPAVTSNDGNAAVVRALAAENGKVYVGGKFTTVGGQARRNLAAVDSASGAVAPFSANVGDGTSTVYALAADASRVYLGGTFGSVNGAGRGNLAAVNATTGAVDAAWRARANNVVRALAFGPNNDGTLFAVGGFKNVTGSDGARSDRQSVARFDASTGNVHPWAVPVTMPDGSLSVPVDSGRNDNMTCWAETVTQSRIFVGCGLGPNYSAAFRLDNGNTGDRAWLTGWGGNPQASAMSPDGTRLIVGGHFGINPIKQQACGKPLGGLIALNPENGQIDCSSNWVPHLDQNVDPSYDGAWSVVSTPQNVWVGGGFVGVSGQPRTNLARFTYDPTLKTVNAAPRVDLDGPPQPTSGPQRGGLDASYFNNMELTGTPAVTRTDATVDFDWGGGSPDPAIGQDGFSARWSGQVEAPVSGEYTFTTTSDDGVRLFVDGQQVIDNWTNHGPTDDSATVTLEAGRRYDIQMDHYENGGGALARLQWSYPGQDRQVIPSGNLFYTSPSTGGLDASYFDNTDFTGPQVTRTDATVDFDWGNGSPDPAIGPDTFSARWSGQVEAPVSGDYTFTTTADDGVRFFLDSAAGNKLVIDNWSDRAPTDDSGTVTLEAGRRYDVQMDYYENGGGALARLQWSYPGQGRQVIPRSALFNAGNLNYSATFEAGSGPSAIVSNALTVGDADDANIKSATVKLTGNSDVTAEKLSADTAGTAINADYDGQSGTLSLNGSAPKADYQRVLRTVAYNNTCANPTSGDRQASFVVSDGAADSQVATSTINVQSSGGPSGGDCSGLSVQAPAQRLPAAGSTVNTSTVPVNVRWSATGESGVVSRYDLQRSTDGGPYQDLTLTSATTTAQNFQLEPGSEYRFRVRATDGAGNTSAWAEGQQFALEAQQDQSAGVLDYSGTWAEQALSTAFNGSTMHSAETNAKATFAFTGTDVSWVAQRGPDRGKAEVWLDGALVESIDLYATSAQPRRVVYNASSLDPSQQHTLEVRVLGTKRAASANARVDVDAFVALR